MSVNGLKSVKLIGHNGIVREQALSGDEKSVSFDVPHQSGWLALVVEDGKAHKAYSNPIWLKTVEKSKF